MLDLLSASGIKELTKRIYVKEVYATLKRRYKSPENYKDITDDLHIPKHLIYLLIRSEQYKISVIRVWVLISQKIHYKYREIGKKKYLTI